MRTPHPLYSETPVVYPCELDTCPTCQGPLKIAYVSGPKTVQTLSGIECVAQAPKRCADRQCPAQTVRWKSAAWQQLAPRGGTYGYDVIARIGWLRQQQTLPYADIWEALPEALSISVSQVRYLYHFQYQPLLACHERQKLDQLGALSQRSGLLLSLDGLVPEGGEPQLWLIRELQTGWTLRSGWLSQQDQTTFENFLRPIADLGLRVLGVLSDKQRGLVPAVAEVFREARHGFCHAHYFQNAALPVAEADEAMKVTLRQGVRQQVGDLLRREPTPTPGVLTVTGLIPSPVAPPPASPVAPPRPETPPASPVAPPRPETPPALPLDPVAQTRAAITQALVRRVRYLLTLKGRPPFRLAGIEMCDRLQEVVTALERVGAHYPEPTLVRLQHGLEGALQAVQSEYTALHQAAEWLTHLADLLDPAGKPARSGAQVRQALFEYLDTLQPETQGNPRLQAFAQAIRTTTDHYAPGLFQCYDLPGLPRTNNARESEFRDLKRRLLRTTGQVGLVRRILQREGAWELIPPPDTFEETVQALQQVRQAELEQEQHRVRTHRQRFRLHTRAPKQGQTQMEHLVNQWMALPATNSP